MKPLLFAFIVFLFIGCTQGDKPIHKLWLFNDDLPEKDAKDITRVLHLQRGSGLNSANFINLQNNGNYTSYLLGEWDEGRWQLQQHRLSLKSHSRGTRRFTVNRVTDDEAVLTDPSIHLWYCFNGFSNETLSPTDNPFAKENNLWRVPAIEKETDAQITARLHNHFRFWEKYFAWGKTQDQTLKIGAIPGPLQMHGNGFELKHYSYQPLDWANLFYDTADCYKAYEKLYYLFAAKNIKWPETKNRYDNFISAFQQLQEWTSPQPSSRIGGTGSAKR